MTAPGSWNASIQEWQNHATSLSQRGSRKAWRAWDLARVALPLGSQPTGILGLASLTWGLPAARQQPQRTQAGSVRVFAATFRAQTDTGGWLRTPSPGFKAAVSRTGLLSLMVRPKQGPLGYQVVTKPLIRALADLLATGIVAGQRGPPGRT
jgi:hypothetical protein